MAAPITVWVLHGVAEGSWWVLPDRLTEHDTRWPFGAAPGMLAPSPMHRAEQRLTWCRLGDQLDDCSGRRGGRVRKRRHGEAVCTNTGLQL